MRANKFIVLSLLAVVLVFVGAGISGDHVSAQSATPSISSLSASSGAVGTTITINGSGFTSSGNNIHFGGGGKANVSSPNGTTLTFTIPSTIGACDFTMPSVCSTLELPVNPGVYQIFVANAAGTSNTTSFTVTSGTCLSGSTGCPPPPTPTPTPSPSPNPTPTSTPTPSQQPLYFLVGGVITSVDTNSQTVTVGLLGTEPLGAQYACAGTNCPTSNPMQGPVMLVWGQVLVLNANDQIVNALSGLKVGDPVSLYEKIPAGSAAIPYMLKDDSGNTNCPAINCAGGMSGGVSTGGSTALPTAASPNAYFSIGSSASEVLLLQQRLQSLGYFPTSTQPTGYFGQITASAVKAYQSATGLPSTGVFGPITRNALGL